MAKRFRKQLLKKGAYTHPNDPNRKMIIDDEVANSLVANFSKGIIDKVPVPLTHTDNAKMNTGYVAGVEATEDGVDVLLDILDDEVADRAEKGLITGVSAGLDFNYIDKKTGEAIGPTLFHVALVNHPYIKGMGEFTTLSEGGSEDTFIYQKEVQAMDLEQIKSVLKTEHNIDLDELQTKATEVDTTKTQLEQTKTELGTATEAVATAQAELSEIKTVLNEGKVELSEGGKVADSVKAILTEKVNLSQEVATLRAEALNTEADKAVTVLLSEGKIAPVEKDEYAELYKSNKPLFERLASKLTTKVDLSERGLNNNTQPKVELSEEEAMAEVERISREGGYKQTK